MPFEKKSEIEVMCMIEALEDYKKTLTYQPQIDRIDFYVAGMGYALGLTDFDDDLIEAANKIKKQRKYERGGEESHE